MLFLVPVTYTIRAASFCCFKCYQHVLASIVLGIPDILCMIVVLVRIQIRVVSRLPRRSSHFFFWYGENRCNYKSCRESSRRVCIKSIKGWGCSSKICSLWSLPLPCWHGSYGFCNSFLIIPIIWSIYFLHLFSNYYCLIDYASHYISYLFATGSIRDSHFICRKAMNNHPCTSTMAFLSIILYIKVNFTHIFQFFFFQRQFQCHCS